MARMTLTDFQTELDLIVGGRSLTSEYTRAVNHAMQLIVSKNIETLQWEYLHDPPYMIQGTLRTGTGTIAADANIVEVSSGTGVVESVGQAFKFDDHSGMYRVIKYLSSGPSGGVEIYIAPAPSSALTSEDWTIYQGSFALPNGDSDFVYYDTTAYKSALHIIDVTDLSNNRKLRRADERFFDKLQPEKGDPIWYAKTRTTDTGKGSGVAVGVKLHPAPDATNKWYQVRYAHKPDEISSGSSNLGPLPVEWDRVVLYEAASHVLRRLQEYARADEMGFQARQLEAELNLVASRQENPDSDFGLRPRRR